MQKEVQIDQYHKSDKVILRVKDLTLQPRALSTQAMKSTPTVASLPESKFSLVKDLLDTV